MEAFNIRVLAIEDTPTGKIKIAAVRAISKRKIGGKPIASIQMQVRLRAIRNETSRKTSRRAYDEALLFLAIL